MRRPGGAVSPAMNDTIGFVVLDAWPRLQWRVRKSEVRRVVRQHVRRGARRTALHERARLDKISRLLLSSATNLTDHDDALSLWVCDEALQAVHEVRAIKWIATYAHARRLSKTDRRRLKHLPGAVRSAQQPLTDC